jgi:ethanolamine transporter EutH
MELSNTGKKFVYTSITMMVLSMALPWESLSDYTYSESMGLLMNIISAVIFAISALLVILKPLASALSRFGTNYIFLLLCLLNAIVLYFGMQYYPDTYTIGYLLFPSSVVFFMLGTIFSIRKIDGSQA